MAEKIFEVLLLRKNVILVILVIISSIGCFFYVGSKVNTREKLELELKQKQEVLKVKEEGLQNIVSLEREHSGLTMELENLRKEKEMPLFVSTEAPLELISFFSNWTKIARITEVKIKSIKPTSASDAAGKPAVEVILEGRYSDMFDFFSGVSRVGSLPRNARFEMKESERGYPLLSMNIMIGL